jgi:DNA-binding NarL/FixJ family response regulator
MADTRIRVLCIDDHRIVREGVALLLNRQRDMKVVASGATVADAIELFNEHKPDVTLMDLQLGAQSGLQAIRSIRADHPAARIIVLSMFHGDEDIYRALEAGAAAYLLKDTLSSVLIDVVRDVHAGRPPTISADVQARLDQRAARPSRTARERQVIELVARGMRNKEIADALGISEETVQVHMKKILAKFQVQDRTAALTEAVRRGIVHIV